MVSLRTNLSGSVLEPSCGPGVFLDLIPGAVGIEIDHTVTHPRAVIADFLLWQAPGLFDTIIGNPPYCEHRGLKSMLLPPTANLYLRFIEKCVSLLQPGGELIFIVPIDFFKSSAGRKLKSHMCSTGAFTHFIDTRNVKWERAAVGTFIFR